jgi:hypothetical protein
MASTGAYDRRVDDLDAIVAIEPEVRGLRHPMWTRPFVNRNPGQPQRRCVPGRDAFVG